MSNYTILLHNVLSTGSWVDTRAGKALCKLGLTYTVDLQAGFPVVTEREINYRAAFGELAAFIHGCTKREEFIAFGCNYWNAYGDDFGPIYGAQWRNFNGIDQLKELVESLKLDPLSRRHILTTWNPADLHKMILPPCHLIAQFHVIGNTLNCTVYMRSCDLVLGLPYDIIVYAGLLSLLAKDIDLKPAQLTFMFGNAHIYENHIEQVNKLISENPKWWPQLNINDNTTTLGFLPEHFTLIDYKSGPKLVVPLNL